MVLASRLSRPLQRRCAHCRRVQDVRLPALYHVVVPNKGGGTRRDGGYDCRFCGTANIIPASEMPQGLVLQLPSRAELLPVAATSAETPNASGSETDDVEAPAPSPSPAAPPRPAVKRVPPPAWIVGAKAQTTLVKAFERSKADSDGLCTAFVRTDGGVPALVDPRDQVDDGDLLDWLDRNACELLVLGGSGADGSRWKAVFHPFAGAATLAIEPAAD